MKKDISTLTHKEKNVRVLDMSQYSTDGITDMKELFSNCDKLEKIDFLGFDTSNVENMSYMFSRCVSLVSIELSWFDTSNCITMEGMFDNCNSLRELDLSNFDISKVKNYASMFKDCHSLKKLDLSNFVIMHDAKIDNIFSGCDNLSEIVMHGCDKYTIERIISQYYKMFNKHILYVVDENRSLDFRLPHGATLEEKYGGIPGKVFAYDENCIRCEIDDSIAEGDEIELTIEGVHCEVGKCFCVAILKKDWDLSYIKFRLISILSPDNDGYLVRVWVEKICSVTDFEESKNNSDKINFYSKVESYFDEDLGEGWFVRSQNEKENTMMLYEGYGQSAVSESKFIKTINKLDYLVATRYYACFNKPKTVWAFEKRVLGPHELSPYKSLNPQQHTHSHFLNSEREISSQ